MNKSTSKAYDHYNKTYNPVGDGVLAPSFITLPKNEWEFLRDSMATEATRPKLQQVCLGLWEGELRLVSTDGSRLHMVTIASNKAQAFFDAGGNTDALYALNDPAKQKTLAAKLRANLEDSVPADRAEITSNIYAAEMRTSFGYGVAFVEQERWTDFRPLLDHEARNRLGKPVTFEFRLNDLAVFSDGRVIQWGFYQQVIACSDVLTVESCGEKHTRPLWFTMKYGNHALVMPKDVSPSFDNKSFAVLTAMGYKYE